MNMRKRLGKGNLFLFAGFLFMSICCLLVLSSYRVNKQSQLYSDRLGSKNSRSFTIYEGENEERWNEVLPELEKKYHDFSIYISVPDAEADIQGIYVNGKGSRPPMTEGSFFDETAELDGESLAVIGKSYEDRTEEVNGKKYITLQDRKFEVIGVMGTERASRLNQMIFIDFSTAVNINGINATYTLDAAGQKTVQKLAEEISREMGFQGKVAIALEQEKKSTYELLGGALVSEGMYVMILLSFVLSTVYVGAVWMNCREEKIAVEKLLGFRKREVIMDLGEKYFRIVISAFVSGSLLLLGIGLFQKVSIVIWEDTVKAFLLMLSLSITVFAIMTRRMK